MRTLYPINRPAQLILATALLCLPLKSFAGPFQLSGQSTVNTLETVYQESIKPSSAQSIEVSEAPTMNQRDPLPTFPQKLVNKPALIQKMQLLPPRNLVMTVPSVPPSFRQMPARPPAKPAKKRHNALPP